MKDAKGKFKRNLYPLLLTCLKSFTFKVPVNHFYCEQSYRHNLLHPDVASLP